MYKMKWFFVDFKRIKQVIITRFCCSLEEGTSFQHCSIEEGCYCLHLQHEGSISQLKIHALSVFLASTISSWRCCCNHWGELNWHLAWTSCCTYHPCFTTIVGWTWLTFPTVKIPSLSYRVCPSKLEFTQHLQPYFACSQCNIEFHQYLFCITTFNFLSFLQCLEQILHIFVLFPTLFHRIIWHDSQHLLAILSLLFLTIFWQTPFPPDVLF